MRGAVQNPHREAASRGGLGDVVVEEDVAASVRLAARHREVERTVAVIVDPLDAMIGDVERGASGQTFANPLPPRLR